MKNTAAVLPILCGILILNGCKKEGMPPTLVTNAVTGITDAEATSGGTITSDGGSAVLGSGVCWDTGENPTIRNSKSTDGQGFGTYTSQLTGLLPSTTYFVRAYASNGNGTAYGNVLSFTTLQSLSLVTSEITQLSYKSATSGGNIANDGGHAVIARGVCWGTSENPATTGSKTSDGEGSGSFTSQLTGLLPNTTYYVRAYARNNSGTVYGNTVSFKTPETLSDFDGNYYDTLTIGTQTWMTSDLKTTHLNDGTAIPNVTGNSEWIALGTAGYCLYENNSGYKQTYGALYNWYTVATGKLCPAGWHVPEDSEWITLLNYLGGESVAGGKMKEAGTSHWLSPNTGATNESGFTSLPSGDRIGADGSFYNLGGYAIYWATDGDPTYPEKAVNRVLVFDGTNMRIGGDNKTAGFSVRCIQN